MNRQLRIWPPLLVSLAVTAVLAACTRVPLPPPESREGYPERGARLIQQYGCGGCHTVPGVPRAEGLVGPPLTRFGARSYIAGELPNNPENLRRWIQDPQAVEPGTAMPDLGVSETDAQDIAAYLFTLE
ncbi:cytochrome c family protein [Micromonospora sp. HM5-17]|uniref:c-type cytochrome n=1 Tax=Micromonospora sp. HM5-17 TaxID=2487710 RepID=UPI000F47D95B|nr:c-type cytochrome [Micromonospora sp. HM5-17]ROT28184.1 cytochrome C [Micromonospora sp. HM5-17]